MDVSVIAPLGGFWDRERELWNEGLAWGQSLPFPLEWLKKAFVGRWPLSRSRGPSSGHSLGALLTPCSKVATEKPKHNDLLRTQITVAAVSRSCC